MWSKRKLLIAFTIFVLLTVAIYWLVYWLKGRNETPATLNTPDTTVEIPDEQLVKGGTFVFNSGDETSSLLDIMNRVDTSISRVILKIKFKSTETSKSYLDLKDSQNKSILRVNKEYKCKDCAINWRITHDSSDGRITFKISSPNSDTFEIHYEKRGDEPQEYWVYKGGNVVAEGSTANFEKPFIEKLRDVKQIYINLDVEELQINLSPTNEEFLPYTGDRLKAIRETTNNDTSMSIWAIVGMIIAALLGLAGSFYLYKTRKSLIVEKEEDIRRAIRESEKGLKRYKSETKFERHINYFLDHLTPNETKVLSEMEPMAIRNSFIRTLMYGRVPRRGC